MTYNKREYDRQFRIDNPNYMSDWRKRNRQKLRNHWARYKLRIKDDKERQARYKASQVVRDEVKAGRLDKPTTCQECGAQAAILDGHHDDYSKPLQVRWLCRPCHSKIPRQSINNGK